MKNWFYLLLALPLIVFSCRKDIDDTIVTGTDYQPPVVIVTATLSGQVLGPDGQAVNGALVRVGNNATVSDENGLYQFRGIEMNARGTYVTASKDGFFLGSDRLYPLAGSKNFSRIELLPKTIAGTFMGTDGGTVEVSGASIIFPEGGVVTGANATYNGEVQVAAQWLNPVASNLQDIMPGGLFGINSDSREVMMASLGMLAVELFDEAGNPLQVAPGREAELRFPIPSELLANAPAEIPLWYFDEADGIWVEDGAATLQDGFYVGKVSHFTFWNVDVPSGVELIFISGCVELSDGTPMSDTDLRIIAPSNFYTYAYGVTDADGNFSGYLPAGDLLTFEIFDECGTIQSFEVGPFTEDTDIGSCFVVPAGELASVTGTLVDCDGVGIEDGMVVISTSGITEVTTSDADGNFTFNVQDCGGTDYILRAYDLENNNATEDQAVTVSGDVNVGEISACDNPIVEYVDASTNGTDYFFVDVNLGIDSLNVDSTIWVQGYNIYATGIDGDNGTHRFSLSIADIEVGSYTGSDLRFDYFYQLDGSNYFNVGCDANCDITVNITSNGGPGGYLEGNYSGVASGFEFPQTPIIDAPISGDFRVEIPE